ncbi:MAG: DNA recombination protein RmuC [Ketobacter sp.]|nr:DNA recombination protein RmuC [Ketobacter sp.]
MDIQILTVLGSGLALGLILGGLIGHFRAQAQLQKLRSEAEREQALHQQVQEQRGHVQSQLEQQSAEQQQQLDAMRAQTSQLERALAQAQEQGRQQAALEEKLAEKERLLSELQGELKREHGQVTDLRARLEASQKETHEKIQLLQEAKEQMKLEFQSIAHKLFEDKSEKFTQQNKSNMGEILTPLKEQLSDFKKRVEDVYDKESRDRLSLFNEIVALKDLNSKMTVEAINLTRALKGDSKTQGNWGEMVLERVLEASGLQKGREYETQGQYSNEDGQRLRPDVIVHLPDAKHIIIDSKVSLTAWERYGANDDELNEQHLLAHIDSIKSHIRDLSAKNYPDLYGINAPDYVLMFIPIEPAFLKALESDPALFGQAFDRNIMLVCPSTLLVSLKTIHNIWRYEYQNRNALEIARQAGGLHDQFVLFAESLQDVGDKIDKARQSYDTAHRRLASGKGNLVRRIEQLEVLGAKARKKIPDSLKESAEGEIEADLEALVQPEGN